MKEYYNVKKVSNSSLSWFQISPKYFRMMLDKEINEDDKSYIFEKGEMVHSFLLEPEEFERNYTFLDYETPKSQQQKDFCDKIARFKKGSREERLLRAYKEAYITKESDDKVLEKAQILEKQFKDYIKSIKLSTKFKKVLSVSMYNKLSDIKVKVFDHKIARELLSNEQNSLFGNNEKLFIKNEFEIYWEFMGIECKSMLDRIVIDHENKVIKLIDLKTTSSFGDFTTKFYEYKYYRQVTFYWFALYHYFMNIGINPDEYKKETYVIAINMQEPTEVKVFEISEKTMTEGENEIIDVFNKLVWHFKNNLWDYPEYYYEGKGTEII